MQKKTDPARNHVSGKEDINSTLSMQFRKWRKINMWIDRVILSILLFLTVFIGSGLAGSLMFLEQGIESVEYHSFPQLMEINPDTIGTYTSA